MKRFSFKSGRVVRVAKLSKTDWLVLLQLEFRLNTTLYNFLKVLSLKYLSTERVKQRIKFVCIAMCFLVMSLCSRDVITIQSMTVD